MHSCKNVTNFLRNTEINVLIIRIIKGPFHLHYLFGLIISRMNQPSEGRAIFKRNVSKKVIPKKLWKKITNHGLQYSSLVSGRDGIYSSKRPPGNTPNKRGPKCLQNLTARLANAVKKLKWLTEFKKHREKAKRNATYWILHQNKKEPFCQ